MSKTGFHIDRLVILEGCSGGSWKCINENCDQLRMRKCLNQMDWECCIRIGGCQYHSGQINESGDIIPVRSV
ncbi:MAG: hypothetical protein GY861_13690 [bacterium]|nr:hypothetical protein [bacterium]